MVNNFKELFNTGFSINRILTKIPKSHAHLIKYNKKLKIIKKNAKLMLKIYQIKTINEMKHIHIYKY